MHLPKISRLQRNPRRTQRASSLIVVLVTTTIFALLSAAMGTLILSHNTRASVDKNAALALNAAESALNLQSQLIFANLNLGDAQQQYAATTNTALKLTGDVNAATYALAGYKMPVTLRNATVGATTSTLNTRLGIDTAAGDYCVCWIEYPGAPADPLKISNPAVFYIYGEARIGGVTRTVRAKAGSVDIFKRWAAFGNSAVNIGGAVSVTPTSGSTLGYVGSNGTITIDNTANVGGVVVYGDGTAVSGNVNQPPPNYADGGKKVEIPTINELAEAAFRDGGYTSNAATGIAKFALANDNLSFGTAGRSNNPATQPLPLNGVPTGQFGFPLRLTNPGTTAKNFYLPRLDGAVKIWANVSNGPINVWVNNTNTGTTANDTLTGQTDIVAYKAVDASGNPIRSIDNSPLLHVYYSNPNGILTINGGGNIFAMLYLYNTTANGTPFGTLQFSGNVTINGAVIANTIGKDTGGGTFTMNYPTTVGAGGTTNGALFGLNTPWTEYNPVIGN